MENKPNKIIWHHSADTDNGPQLNKINAYHKSRGFPKSGLGFYVGYHYLIEHNGLVIKCRKETEIGAHDRGENFGSIGICLDGNFNYTTPRKEQKKAAGKLTKEILRRWHIRVARIEPHRWGDPTDCPGTLLPDKWLAFNYIQYEINLITKIIQRLRLMFG